MFDDYVVKQASHGHWVPGTPLLFSRRLREYSWGEPRLFAFNPPNFFFPIDNSRGPC